MFSHEKFYKQKYPEFLHLSALLNPAYAENSILIVIGLLLACSFQRSLRRA
jgi:hypothetical protein